MQDMFLSVIYIINHYDVNGTKKIIVFSIRMDQHLKNFIRRHASQLSVTL